MHPVAIQATDRLFDATIQSEMLDVENGGGGGVEGGGSFLCVPVWKCNIMQCQKSIFKPLAPNASPKRVMKKQ